MAGMMRYRVRLLLVLSLGPMRAFTSAGESSPACSTPRGDSRRAGVSAVDIALPLQPAWRRAVGGLPCGAPTIGRDLIVATLPEGRVLGLTLSGDPRFEVTFDGLRFGGSALLASNAVIVADEGGTVQALDPTTGRERWRQATTASIQGSPLGVGGGARPAVLVMDQSSGRTFCLDAASGAVVWRSEPTSRCDGSLSATGLVGAYGNCDAGVHLLDLAEGKEIGFVPLGDEAQMAGGLALRGSRAYGGTRDGRLVAVDLHSARFVWDLKVSGGELFATPAVDEQHVAAAGKDGALVLCETATGRQLWRVVLEGEPTSPILTPNQVVTTVAGTLLVLAREDGRILGRFDAGDETTPLGIGAGIFVLGTDTGDILGFPASGSDQQKDQISRRN